MPGLQCCPSVTAQGNLVLSNLEEPSDETLAVGDDVWLAQRFSLEHIDRVEVLPTEE